MVSTWLHSLQPCICLAARQVHPSHPAHPRSLQDAELARSYFKDAPNVEVVEIPIRDGWTRDWGPSVSGVGGVEIRGRQCMPVDALAVCNQPRLVAALMYPPPFDEVQLLHV